MRHMDPKLPVKSYSAAARAWQKDADHALLFEHLQTVQQWHPKLLPSWVRGADCLMAIAKYSHIGGRCSGFYPISGSYLN